MKLLVKHRDHQSTKMFTAFVNNLMALLPVNSGFLICLMETETVLISVHRNCHQVYQYLR